VGEIGKFMNANEVRLVPRHALHATAGIEDSFDSIPVNDVPVLRRTPGLDWAQTLVPLRLSSEDVQYLVLGRRRGGRRYLSEDLKALNRLAATVVEQVDRLRTSEMQRGVLSWVHSGDLHMTKAGEQNDLDLRAIVEEINAAFASSVSFVYLPGDVADDGSSAAYAVVCESLDQLKVPWWAIIGDHDVHDKSFANFLSSMAAERNYTFNVGNVRFLAMNAFDIPDPRSFTVLPEQMQWVEQQLEGASERGQSKVLLLHCYPTDLKVGRDHLVELVQKHNVRLIDMGHTHYNEVANDGRTIYTATRSTGQIEEGPVGFSVTNLDDGVVSWRFLELGELPAVMITSPSDKRLITDSSEPDRAVVDGRRVRAKAWGDEDPACSCKSRTGTGAASTGTRQPSVGGTPTDRRGAGWRVHAPHLGRGCRRANGRGYRPCAGW
jgi:predicted phosphodiesterase